MILISCLVIKEKSYRMICLLNRKIGRRKFSLMKVAGWNPTVVVGHTRIGVCRIRKHIVWGFSYNMQFWIWRKNIQIITYVKTTTL
ncbi:hypothetical protein D3H65_30285 [Paraflavitalea soli]|uniref:Uncharacterized protein n=1 Tax=Paraflavitalea soli TaxID=2315862 RepID=A0A3B7N815_9BACT|nr:hypothetical protein D3H65_30285 [Paraflavitalea soli]